MPALNCPSCGAEVPLRSAAMPYAVCAYCQSVVLREGDDLQEIGKAAVLPFDVSPIQLGTTGEADGFMFQVVGRVRWGWSDGSWNEWLLNCSDGQHRWLGEAMGQFQLLSEKPGAMDDALLQGFAAGNAIAPGDQAVVGDIGYAAADIKQAQLPWRRGRPAIPHPRRLDDAQRRFQEQDRRLAQRPARCAGDRRL